MDLQELGTLDSVPVGQKQGFFAMQFSSFAANLPPENDPLMFSSCLPSCYFRLFSAEMQRLPLSLKKPLRKKIY